MSLLVLLRGTAQGTTLTVEPGTGHVVLTGKQAAIIRTLRIAPGTGHSVLAGKQPSVALSRVIAPSAGHVSLSGKQPSLTRSTVIVPATGHVLYSGKQPTLGLTRVIAPAAGHVLLSGKTPGITQTKNLIVLPGTGRLAFSGHTPVVQYTRWPDPADVLLGVKYGPTSEDFTGTAVPVAPPAGFASHMIVTLTTERFTVTQKPKRVASHVVEPTSQQQSSKSKNAYIRTEIPRTQVLTSPDELWVRTNKETI